MAEQLALGAVALNRGGCAAALVSVLPTPLDTETRDTRYIAELGFEARQTDSKPAFSHYILPPNKIELSVFHRSIYIFNYLFMYVRNGEGERNMGLLSHLFMHSSVDSCMCPNQRSNPHLGILGGCSNPMSSPARAPVS